jgi:hypothetical protein
VQPLIEVPLDELAETLRMPRIVRDADDRWFDASELELDAMDSLESRPRLRRHLVLALGGLVTLLAIAGLFWAS